MQATTAVVALRLFSNLNSYGLPEVTSLDQSPSKDFNPNPRRCSGMPQETTVTSLLEPHLTLLPSFWAIMYMSQVPQESVQYRKCKNLGISETRTKLVCRVLVLVELLQSRAMEKELNDITLRYLTYINNFNVEMRCLQITDLNYSKHHKILIQLF